MIKISLPLQLKVVNILFVFFTVLFTLFPYLDIQISEYFFIDGKFMSEKYTSIKDLRSNLKGLMIIIPIFSIFLLCLISLKKFRNQKQKKKT